MAPIVIDLTSSPEPEESPAKAAKAFLEGFKPRPLKARNGLGSRALPPSHESHAQNSGSTQGRPHGLPLSEGTSQSAGRSDPTVTSGKPKPFLSAQLSSMSTLKHTSPSALNPTSTSSLTAPKTQVKPKNAPGAQANKAPAKIVAIDDESETSSSIDSSDSEIDTIVQAELDGIRPFKKRRVVESTKDAPALSGKSRITGESRSPIPPHGREPSSKADGGGVTAASRHLPVAAKSSVVDREAALPRSPDNSFGQIQEATEIPHTSQGRNALARIAFQNPQPEGGLRVTTKRIVGSNVNLPVAYELGAPQTLYDSAVRLREPVDSREMQAADTSHESDLSTGSSSFRNTTQNRGRRLPYSPSEDETLLRLRDEEKLDWKDILPQMPGRSIGSISGHYSELKMKSKKESKASPLLPSATGASVAQTSAPGAPTPQICRPIPYSQEEDRLLVKLRDTDKLEWNDILLYFPGRTMGSISGHYGQIKANPDKQVHGTEVGIQPTGHESNHGVPYSAQEDALLKKLKEVDGLNWEEIVPHFSGRTRGSLQVRYSSKLKSASKIKHASPKLHQVVAQKGLNATHGGPYSAEEDALILKLRGEGLNWDQMAPQFSGRTAGALAVRYSSKLKDRANGRSSWDDNDAQQGSTDDDSAHRPKRRRRHNGPSAMSGFISWADIKKSKQNVLENQNTEDEDDRQSKEQGLHTTQRNHSESLARILRQREVGSNCERGLVPSTRFIPDAVKHHALDDIGPRQFFQGTSGDVTCLAWAENGNRFAAGSIAITDERSMQYNKPYNLMLGEASGGILHELPEHHVERPVNTDAKNVNSLRSMQETQDRRLFMTVAGVQFSPNGRTLYSAGTDRTVRAYAIGDDCSRALCQFELAHPEPVYLLSVSNHDSLATACHQATDAPIRVYQGHEQIATFSPSRSDSQIDRATFPSALKWGVSSHHSNLLLAGFSIDSIDEERNLAGETCLWDVRHGVRVEVNAVTRNVFDVAWNPSPSSGSTAFAVASTPGVNKVTRGTRSVVQCFAPRQNRAAAVLDFESRAFDINDVVYCPHDNNLIAAGATDGKVYVWDQRYYNKSSGPLHVLAHGNSLNVLDHERDRELADTGIRFLAWGATSSRLYSGSSDGVVKVWNPYYSSANAHLRDVATFSSAVMSGAFNPDYRDLIIGEDQGRINLLSIGYSNRSVRSMDRFEIHSATPKGGSLTKTALSGKDIARELVATGQIELRPMGALPIRQAVQGPNYAGPTLAPSPAEFQFAEYEYQIAMNAQAELHLKAAADSTQTSTSSRALQDADERVETAQKTWLQLQRRFDDAEAIRPDAEKLQHGFRKDEKERMKLEASLSYEFQQCKLDCNYLPPGMDEDDEVPDSQRSERRIPTSLWSTAELDTSTMNVYELVDAGFTERCSACLRPALEPQAGVALCSTCAQKRSGLTATCDICSASTRPVLEKHGVNLCEGCNFSCFRCGKPAIVAPSKADITCYNCDLSWTARALGYELMDRRK